MSALTSGARELLRRRLASQLLAPAGGERSAPTTARGSAPDEQGPAARVAEVTRRMLALQGQDFGQGVWALGARVPGSTRRDVFAALDSGAVVRSWPMRGTLHLLDPDDLRGFLSITATRTVSGAASRHRALGIGSDDVSRARDLAVGLLRGGGRASRDEFMTALASAGLDPAGQRGVHLIWLLAHEGLLCWGPMAAGGTQQTLVLLDEWAPPTRDWSPDGAHDELLLRYIRGHGPTTLKDFCWWTKLLVADATAALERIRDRVDELEIEVERGTGSTTFLVAADEVAPADPDEVRSRRPDAHLALPGFDEYLLGYRSRSPALAAEYSARVVPGDNGMFLPMLVSRGAIVGTWKRRIGARAVSVTLEPFAPLSDTERRGFERALGRYAAFLELPSTVVTT